MKVYFLHSDYSKHGVCFSKEKELLENIKKTRSEYKNDDMYRIDCMNLDKDTYMELHFKNNYYKVKRYPQYDNFIATNIEIEQFTSEDMIFQLILTAAYSLSSKLDILDKYIHRNIKDRVSYCVTLLRNKFLYELSKQKDLTKYEDEFNDTGLLKYFVFFYKSEVLLDSINGKFGGNKMSYNKLTEEECLEKFTRDLIKEYKELLYLKEILILEPQESVIMDMSLNKYKELIKKIVEAKSVGELKKYLKYGDIVRDYRRSGAINGSIPFFN